MLFSTDAAKQAHAAIRQDHPWAGRAIEFMGVAADLFTAAARAKYQGNDPARARQVVVMQTLGIRVMNSVSATTDLISSGYFQQAAMLIRDVLECAFLLDLFSRRPEHLQPWIDLGIKAGKDAYKPGQVRALLNDIDGPDGAIRNKFYGFYSRHATHPNSEGLIFIAPEDHAVEIGPFVSGKLMLFLMLDLTRFVVMAAQHQAMWFHTLGVDLAEGPEFDAFSAAFEANSQKFFGLNAFLTEVNQIEGQMEIAPPDQAEDGAD